MASKLKNAKETCKNRAKEHSNPSSHNTRRKSVSEFRAISQKTKKFAGHPVYTYRKIGDDLIVLVITHDKKNSNRSKVVKLDKNPSDKDTSDSKIHKKARIINRKLCGKRYSRWSFKTMSDREKVKKIIEDNKGRNFERIE